jgi:hypothetical protein
MSEKLKIPMIVRERLKAIRPASAHPDPDQLAAFSEQQLGERERAMVLDHLAGCEECRTVLALSTAETAEIPLRREPRAFIARWRMWRWAALTASAAVVVVIATQYDALRPRPLKVERANASVSQHAAQPNAEVAQNAPAAAAARKASPAEHKQSAGPAASAPSAPIAKSLAEGNEAFARDKLALAQPLRRGAVSLQARLPSLEKKDLKTTESADLAAANQTAASASAVGGGITAAPPQPASAPLQVATNTREEGAPVAKAKEPIAPRSYNENVEVTAGAPLIETEQAQLAAKPNASHSPVLVWRLHRGQLQQSSDAGRSWAAVEVPLVAEQHWNAIAYVGSNVWVGGGGESLYHTPDAGAHWEEQSLQAGPLSTNETVEVTASEQEIAPPKITKIAFTDGQHGTATLASNGKKQIYTTEDGGTHWALSLPQ